MMRDYIRELEGNRRLCHKFCSCAEVDIIHGNVDGTFNPLGYATRAEAAVLMNNVYNFVYV